MTALSGHEEPTVRQRFKKSVKNVCSVKTVKKVVPIIGWLPQYNCTTLFQDIIAGITVGLTAIPQGIAYAVIAGLSPEYGLYSGLMGGFVYLFFGSCKTVTVGPTAIMAAMVARYVSGYSADFAVLACFLAGIVELCMGILNLGFLVDFISIPVISGFTTAAALQIASAQLKSLFGLEGPSGNLFAESVYNFIINIKTMTLWNTLLGFFTIFALMALKRLGEGCSRNDGNVKKLRWFISLGRNAIVVIIGILIAYITKMVTNEEPFKLIGDIGSGLPTPHWPPFSTVVGNETYYFADMMTVFGFRSIVIPFVAILESIAIAKAFSFGVPVDATQEMIAVGLCNIIGSFMRSMPITGSFTRTALNHASGVQTPAGGVFKGLVIILALSLLTSTFYFIPKASLAGLIITAMFSMIDFSILGRLWINSKKELLILLSTIIVCLTMGLEYGIVTGILLDALVLLFNNARPSINVNILKVGKLDLIVLPLHHHVSYCASEHIRKAVLRASQNTLIDSVIIIDATNLMSMDSTVASNLMSAVSDLEKKSFQVLMFNFNASLKKICLDINPKYADKFVSAAHVTEVMDAYGTSV
ncbi:sodium-independent sulfate anion transporter-like [Leptidea sinapis]|uniref:sodium-independent sulfate anion transporter-like n=1 Tax=Leptidea sinapis TaxID=189913 RepID=UPI0021C49D5D|nr:sodium-independent sulfate anion transporter-like [Leptidea sinapis]